MTRAQQNRIRRQVEKNVRRHDERVIDALPEEYRASEAAARDVAFRSTVDEYTARATGEVKRAIRTIGTFGLIDERPNDDAIFLRSSDD